jgi:DNA-binding MarR family transcriptional regulator
MSRNAAHAGNALDDLLATLQGGGLSPLELRILLQLAERDASPANLANALDTEPKLISSTSRRLAMRGLIGRRFDERGRDSRFVLSIRSGGLRALAPLVERVADAHPPGDDDLILVRRMVPLSTAGRANGVGDHGFVYGRRVGSAGRDPSMCRALR